MADRIDEIMGAGGGEWSEQPPLRPSSARMHWKPGMKGETAEIKLPDNTRFGLPRPAPEEMPHELGDADIDAIMAQIKAEDELPPHKKNAAKIFALKQQALDMMRQQESQWVQSEADRLLPRLDEAQVDC